MDYRHVERIASHICSVADIREHRDRIMVIGAVEIVQGSAGRLDDVDPADPASVLDALHRCAEMDIREAGNGPVYFAGIELDFPGPVYPADWPTPKPSELDTLCVRMRHDDTGRWYRYRAGLAAALARLASVCAPWSAEDGATLDDMSPGALDVVASGSTGAPDWARRYARQKAKARRARLDGNIATALMCERACESIYHRLVPDECKW